MNFPKSLVVNLIGGPGCSKSSIMGGLYHDLKFNGIEAEMAPEYAKECVWNNNLLHFNNQIKMFGEQHHRIFHLLGQVEVIITDSPLLLTPIYVHIHGSAGESETTLSDLALEQYLSMWNYTVFLKRHEASFKENGRNHNLEECKTIDKAILYLMDDAKLPYETVDAGPTAKDYICKKVLTLLGK
jgi:hypothetical protein